MPHDYGWGRPRRDYDGERWGRDDERRWGRSFDHDDFDGHGRGPAGRDYDRARRPRDYAYDRDQRERDREWGRTRWTGATGQFDRDFEGRPWSGWDADDYAYNFYGRSTRPDYGRYSTPDASWRRRPGDYYGFARYGEARYDWDRAGEPDYGRSYAGRGPRGYQRRDERILEDVCDRLCDDARIDASEVDVRVSDGEVTLSGTVDDRWQKRLAERVAETVWGVRDVHNRLRISRHPSEGRTGTDEQGRVREGMVVLGADGGEVGRVKEIGRERFLLDRPMARDLYVPLTVVRHVAGDQVVLDVPADRVDDQGWPKPDIVGEVTSPIANAATTVRPQP